MEKYVSIISLAKGTSTNDATKLLDSRGRVNDVPMALLARSSGETLWDWLVAQTECFEIVHAVECKDSGIEPEELAGKPDCSRDLIVV